MDTTTTSQEEVPPLSQGLIVDFPCKPRVSLKSRGIVYTAPTFAPPRVGFSKFSQLVIIPYDDMESKWYTREDQRHFYQARRSDIRKLRDMLRDGIPALGCEDILCECLGIENYLTPCIARRVVLKKQAHSEAILSAQMMHQGNNRIDKLSETSMKSSQWAREKAAKVAAVYLSCV
jgi:hypothetical protein